MAATIRPVKLDDYDALHDLLEALHSMHVEGMPALFKMPNDAILEREHVAGLMDDDIERFLKALGVKGLEHGMVHVANDRRGAQLRRGFCGYTHEEASSTSDRKELRDTISTLGS